MTVDLLLNDFKLANGCAGRVPDARWCIALISRAWMLFPVSFNLFALCNAEFFSWIIRTSSVFDSRRVWTSPSACRRSSALKRSISFAFINSSYCSLCFGFFFRVLDIFLQYQLKYILSCALTLSVVLLTPA